MEQKEVIKVETIEKDGQMYVVEVVEKEDGEKEVKKILSKKKATTVNQSLTLDYKFDEVISEEAGELSFGEFDFNIFEGMTAEIERVKKEYNKIANNSMYSADYISEKRIEALMDMIDIESKYRDKALKQIAELRKPTMTTRYMSQHEEQMNMLKRLNNNIIASEMMKTATVEELASLFENNKDNVDIRTMIKLRVNHLFRVVKDKIVREQAFKVIQQINKQELEDKNVAYFQELDRIENGIIYAFKMEGAYPDGLEKGFKNVVYKKYFD